MINILTLKESINFFFICTTLIALLGCVLLYLNTKKLKQQIADLKKERKEILERKVLAKKDQDLVSIQNISLERKEPNIQNIQKKSTKTTSKEGKLTTKPKLEYVPTMSKKNSREEDVTRPKKNIATNNKEKFIYKTSSNHLEEKAPIKNNLTKKISSTNATNTNKVVHTNQTKTNIKENHSEILSNISKQEQNSTNSKSNNNSQKSKKIYQKNTLLNRNQATSPVSIPKQETFDIDKLSFDLNEFIKRSEKVVPKIEEKKSTPDYLKEISSQLENALEPDPIELTEYEKEQEEHAIISYQELLSLKDNIEIKDDEEETIDFIEELKNFRNTLH